MNVQTHVYEATTIAFIPLGIIKVSLSFIFRLHRLFFGVSALTFRCKFCIPLGTSFELLRLLFRRYRIDFRASPYISAESALTFRCKLCIPLGTSLELLPVFSFLFALDGACSAFTFTFLGDIALVELK
jgi:hypothetical protein